MKINVIDRYVREVLEEEAPSRDNDDLLYALVCQKTNYEQTKEDFMTVMVSGCMPAYVSVTRARRKLQEKYTELRGQKYRLRHEKEAEFEEYNREVA